MECLQFLASIRVQHLLDTSLQVPFSHLLQPLGHLFVLVARAGVLSGIHRVEPAKRGCHRISNSCNLDYAELLQHIFLRFQLYPLIPY